MPSIQFTKAGGAPFQAHTLTCIENFFEKLPDSVAVLENVENGSGGPLLVTKDNRS